MEHFIYFQIVNFLVPNNLFHPAQHGFRKGLSCDTQLAVFFDGLSSNLDLNVPVDVLFLDFERSFDKAPHQQLLLKLYRLNINPSVLDWIRDFLTNR